MRQYLIIVVALLALGLLLSGCESDSTAPDEELPATTSEDVANQSGYMAMAMVRALPRIWDPTTTKDNGEYTYALTSGSVLGVIYSEFYDAEGGSLVDYDVAGWCHVYTDDPLNIVAIEGSIPWLFGFDLTADINQATDSATVSGGGSLVVGNYNATFTFDALVIRDGDSYPASGTITFVNEGITAAVQFNGNDTATVTVGVDSWTIDLGNGTVS